ncbi:MAG: hypothetical protein EB127_25565 [Alphaproteobacteria bacterium]|nr:hypothetical protein [Alphaproteobacteria bacterium]
MKRNQYKLLAEKYKLVQEDEKEDILAGLGAMEKKLSLAGKTADMFVIHVSGEYDYEKNVKVSATAQTIEWSELPATLRRSTYFRKKPTPGLAYDHDENGFMFYIVDPDMKKILRDAMLSDYPNEVSTTILNTIQDFSPCKQWCDGHLWDNAD